MHDYLFTSEVVRFAFMLGVAVSMLLYERRHLTTGSIVVPGYVATFAVYPQILVATAVNAAVSYLIVNRLLNRWFLLYGRSKFTVLALVSISIQTAMLKLSPSGSWLWESDIKLFVGVGYVVPALIAHDMGRQGIVKTIKSVSLASAIVLTPIALALWAGLPGINDLAPLTGTGRMAIDAAWIPLAVLLSAGAAWGVSHNHGLRSGGFMGASFVAILLGDPWQVAVALSLAALTYLFVTRVLMGEMILFGRRKFSAMLLVSGSAAWTLLWLASTIVGTDTLRHVDVGSLALTPLIVPGLIANDAQRTGPRQVLAGLTLATTFVLTTTWWLQSVVQHSPLRIGWKVASLLAFAYIFRPQLARIWIRATAGSPSTQIVEPVLVVAAPMPPAAAPAPLFGFTGHGYDSWARLHREAADAAESWLTALIGDFAPSLALVAVTPESQPEPARDPRAIRLCRWRAAAVRALQTEATPTIRATGGWASGGEALLPQRTRRTAATTDSVPGAVGSNSMRSRLLPPVGTDHQTVALPATPMRVVPSDAPTDRAAPLLDVALPAAPPQRTEQPVGT
ncbi:MAG: poly-gamma-glutamate biosynthesis protein PgsC/CapC [Ilumatobacteraceae bacterium]